jgi:hypothetical protein
MIVEDVHWADDATLDVLRYLAWRVAELPSVLVLTYRDDELRDDHPLRRVLGALARQDVERLALQRLSPGAIQELSTPGGADAGAVLHITGGNPFFVTEVLASPDVEVPATVRDAVLARLGELGDGTQRSLELLSTIPGQVERRGVLEADPAHVWFRHELARRAIKQQLSSTARVAYNRQVLAALAGTRTSSCPGWPITRTRPGRLMRSSGTVSPPHVRRPPPARSTRRSRTTNSPCGGRP